MPVPDPDDIWKKEHSYSDWETKIFDESVDDIDSIIVTSNERPPGLVNPLISRVLLLRIVSILKNSGASDIIKANGYIIRAWDKPKYPWYTTDIKEFFYGQDQLVPGLNEQISSNKFSPFDQCFFCPNSRYDHNQEYGDNIEIASERFTSRQRGEMDIHTPFFSHHTGNDIYMFSPGSIDIYIPQANEEGAKNLIALLGSDKGVFDTDKPVYEYLRSYFVGKNKDGNPIAAITGVINYFDQQSILAPYHSPSIYKILDTLPGFFFHIENRRDILFPGMGDSGEYASMQFDSDYFQLDNLYSANRKSAIINLKQQMGSLIYCDHSIFNGGRYIGVNESVINSFLINDSYHISNSETYQGASTAEADGVITAPYKAYKNG